MSSVATALPAPGRSGRAEGPPGLVVREVHGLRTASLVARRGAAQQLAAACLEAYGVELPATPRAVDGRGATFVWVGPAQWLVELPPGDEEIEALLAARSATLPRGRAERQPRRARSGGAAGARRARQGAADRPAPGAFRIDDVAVTAIAHVGLQLRQISEAPCYRLAVVRSYFGSFWHWLASSSAEYGCEVIAARAPHADRPPRTRRRACEDLEAFREDHHRTVPHQDRRADPHDDARGARAAAAEAALQCVRAAFRRRADRPADRLRHSRDERRQWAAIMRGDE